jgi:hypothetical protein
MTHTFRKLSATGALILAAALTGCAGTTVPTSITTATTIPSATPAESEQGGAPPTTTDPVNTPTFVLPPPTGGGGDVIVGGSVESGPAVTGVPAGTEPTTDAPPATDESGELAITLADNGKTITLKTGQTFLLKLDMAFNWAIDLKGGDVIIQVMTFAPIPGAQGMYSANRPGTASISAIGSLPCHSETPPCMAPSPLFEVTLVVE